MDTNNDFILSEEILNEKTVVSFHKRPVETMVATQKEKLTTANHTIIHHKTFKDGSHEILHKSPSKKLRVTTISQSQKRGVVSKVINRPAPVSVRQKHSV